MRFMGTSAGEGTPTPFCSCKYCKTARERGGRELRLRSSFRLDEFNAIDLGIDSVATAQKLGTDFCNLRNVFYTHIHDDHFDRLLIWTRSVSEHTPEPLNLWFSEEGIRVLEDSFFTCRYTEDSRNYFGESNVKLHVLKHYEETDCGDFLVTAIPGFHRTPYESHSNNLIFKSKKDGTTVLYALDTSLYPDEAFEKLRGKRFDIVITEHTFPTLDKDFPGDLSSHMDTKHTVMFFDKLREVGCTDGDSRLFVTHTAPVGSNYKEQCEFFDKLDRPYRVTVAYDGMYI